MSVIKKASILRVKTELGKCTKYVELYNWIISPIDETNLVFTVDMASPVDFEKYRFDVGFDNYNEWPVTIDFLDLKTGEKGLKSSYPSSKKHGQFFHPKPCICHPSCRNAYGSYTNLHNEWDMAGWKENPKTGSLKSLEAIFLAIYYRINNSEIYGGRMK
ncbi:MAG: hypothetical protein IIA45_01015 [Bacteroidetes bacterium]|nr:hypothetical protein [Bacteroidota bacterium]